MTRTHLVLDGLQDPSHAQELSARWASAGFTNVVDPAAQGAWLEPGSDRGARDQGPSPRAASDPSLEALTARDVDRAASIARAFGLEVRDRAGKSFRPDNDLEALRARIVAEYRTRFATALVFGLPALGLHWFGGLLARGGGTEPRDMLYPWMFQMLLVGWAVLASAWPLCWQGGLGALHLRTTADVLTAGIIAASFLPSALGVFSLLFTREPWFGSRGPVFHATMWTVLIAVLQRWLAHRAAPHLSGRAELLIRRFSRVVALWLVLAVAVTAIASWRGGAIGWHWGLAIAMLMPPMVSLGAIQPWSPGPSVLLPVFAFTVLLLVGPAAFEIQIDTVCVEIAAGFGLLMTAMFATGWRAWERGST